MTHLRIRITDLCLAPVLLLLVCCVGGSPAHAAKPLSIGEARLKVTGARHNRPDAYKGIGDFIGWPGGVDRLSNGDLLVTHSSGYWHSSFAMPRLIEPKLARNWRAEGWPLDFVAPTGGS